MTFCHIQTSDVLGCRGPDIKVWVYVGRGLTQTHTARSCKKTRTPSHARSHAPAMTTAKFECEIVLMSASRVRISLSLSPEPSADNYSRPFSPTRSHQSCQSALLEPEELSPRPSQSGARQGQALCSISLLIPVHLSFSSITYPLLPPSPPTLSLLNFTPGLTSISRTTSALTLIHFQSCGVVG